MSNLPKSKRFDVIDKFNDTSPYLDIFIIDGPEFVKHIPEIYIQKNFSWIKQMLRTKKLFFLNLNVKVIVSNIKTSVYDKRDEF